MRNVLRLLIGMLLALSSHWSAAVEPISIPSHDGKLQLRAYWFQAKASEPRPAIITLHGCSGALDSHANLSKGLVREAGYFNAEKMHFLALESFTARGEQSICSTPPARRQIRVEDRRDDVFAATAWLAQQPGVDQSRIAIIGRSHGGSTVLSVMDRSEPKMRMQALRPKAAIALYPGCLQFTRMWDYDLSAPLLLMIGASDDWTPAKHCVTLQEKVKRTHRDASFELHVFPDSHHAFDGMGPVRVLSDIGGTRSGTATVGANPEYREKAHRRTFDFLSAQLGVPLLLTHEERLHGHSRVVPAASGFARIDDISSLPLGEKGQARYRHYLGLNAPKAFVITENKGWYLGSNDRDAMQSSLERCRAAKLKCWLYAVDDRVVWQAEPGARVDLKKLLGND